MTVKDLIKYFEDWAPQGIAWEKDNIGLQVGSQTTKIKNIFLALELDDRVLSEALNKNCNLIITHHPFIFDPLKKIDTSSDLKAELIQRLLRHKVSIYSAHTNLDFTKDGVSFELAKVLKLRNIKFLVNQDSNQFKLTVFVPVDSCEKVAEAIFNAGGGIIGEYKKCSFRLEGKGTFQGSEFANPAVGKKQNFETVDEIRLEVVINTWSLNKVIHNMISAHPYEEPAFDIYPLKNKNVNYGFGTIGDLEKPMTQKDFLFHVSKSLNVSAFKYCNSKSNIISKVAVCGGSGSRLADKAVSAGADAFVTADVKYHTFQEFDKKILLIDAGHYETEIHSLKAIEKKLNPFIKQRNEKIKIIKFRGSTNPAKIFNNKGVK